MDDDGNDVEEEDENAVMQDEVRQLTLSCYSQNKCSRLVLDAWTIAISQNNGKRFT